MRESRSMRGWRPSRTSKTSTSPIRRHSRRDQMRDIFLAFIAHTIEGRLLQDIGANGLKVAADLAAIDAFENQLRDYIRRSVRDSFSSDISDARLAQRPPDTGHRRPHLSGCVGAARHMGRRRRMRRHSIIARLGPVDKAPVKVLQADSLSTEIRFVDGYSRLGFGLGQIIDQLAVRGVVPSETAVDLGILAATITAADTRISPCR